jgi:lipopolysaccharide export system protein LptA
VNGRFVSKGPSGDESVMEIQGRGMVFQASLLDHLRPVLDEQGRQVGVTNILRRRVLFHHGIGVKSEGSNAAPLIPFQDAPQPVAKEAGKRPKQAPKLGGPPEARSRTVIVCEEGPCIIDLAVRPRTLTPNEPEREILLAQRFEFLNGVILRKVPLDPLPGANPSPVEGPRADLRCTHLCFQYPPQAMASLPEYAEALGGVHMQGTHRAAEGATPTPFRVDCQRVYFDGASDASILEGLPGTPIEIADEAGDLSTQTCVVTRKTQTLYMPGEGPKRALVHSVRKAAPPSAEPKPTAGGIDLGGGDLEAHWMGPFRREVVRILATPGQPESVKEVLTLTKNVDIVQQAKGLRIQGQFIRIVRDAAKGQVERLEGHGQVLVRSGDMQVKGESVAVNLRYGPENEIVQNTVIVWGQRENHTPAVLWQGQSAVRSERFVIDALNNNFQAYGGVVARVNLPAPSDAEPKPEAAGGAALMPGFSLTASGKLGLQCEGDFEFDGGSGLLRATQNVLLHQEGMQIVSDSLVLALQQPPKPDDPKNPPAPDQVKTRDADKDKDKAKPDDAKSGLFSGNVQSVECGGRVELVTPTQVVHCDRLFYNMVEDQAFLDMARPEDVVRIYLKEPAGGTKILEVAERLDYNGKTGVFEPRRRMMLKPYQDKVPLPRGSPALARPVPVAPGGGKAP